MYTALSRRTDPAQSQPQAIPGVAEEQVREGDQEFTVIRSPRGAYLRLTPEQRAIWQQMDGTRTVAQLATGAFLQFKQLLPVGDLVEALYVEGFLIEQPVGVYRAIAARLEDKTAEGWGKRVLRFLSGRRLEIRRIDAIYRLIYRWFGWLFFTPVFIGMWLVVAISGGAAFARLLVAGSNLAATNLPWAVAVLVLALLISFLLHESAHALAVKHFRRILGGGGIMLYFGMPAFYVDTSDIWRSPRRARVLVSAAGPMSDLFLGGLAAIYSILQPTSPLAPIATTLAITCYIATLANANPLLELDGYYILVDLLRLPDLRQRALAFVRGPLWGKLRPTTNDQQPMKSSGDRRWSFVIGRFSREERIFTLYGLLTAAYSAVALWFAWQFWQRWLLNLITRLWSSGNWPSQFVAAALVLGVVAPALFGLGALVLGTVRGAVGWLIRRGYGRRPDIIAATCTTVVLALALLFGRDGGPPYAVLLPPLLWAVAGVALALVRPDYTGATVFPAFNALLPATALAAAAALTQVLAPDLLLWQVAAGCGLLFVLLAAFFAQLDVNVRLASPRVQVSSALMLMLAFAVGGLVLIERLTVVGTPLLALLQAAPSYFGALALALLLPYMFSLNHSRLFWPWALLWGAVLAETTAYVVDLRASSVGLDVLAAGLWAAAWVTHLATLRQITPAELPWDHVESLGERERLGRAFQLCYAGCYRLLRAVYGARRTREFDDRMDVLAATANWDVRLDRDLADVGLGLLAQPLDVQGARFAEVLRYTVLAIEDIAGATFARRTMQAAYDALPWPERETAGRLCFPDTPWARSLSSTFGDAQQARVRLLRDVDALANCSDAELAAVGRSARQQQVRAGKLLLREGEPVPGVWIIEAGEIIAQQGVGQLEQELHRASAFGMNEVASQQNATRNYRASIDSSLLFLSAAEFRLLVPANTQPTDAYAATVRLFERVPLFAQLPRAALKRLAEAAQPQQFAPRAVVVQQGVPSGMFYVIESGRAAVITRDARHDGEKATLRMLARLGPDEFFGFELVDATTPRAHVLAETALSVQAIPLGLVRDLMQGNTTAARNLAQISTGRLRAFRS